MWNQANCSPWMFCNVAELLLGYKRVLLYFLCYFQMFLERQQGGFAMEGKELGKTPRAGENNCDPGPLSCSSPPGLPCVCVWTPACISTGTHTYTYIHKHLPWPDPRPVCAQHLGSSESLGKGGWAIQQGVMKRLSWKLLIVVPLTTMMNDLGPDYNRFSCWKQYMKLYM